MTNSMIPYIFTAGTKAKAGEVNANFSSVADAITNVNNDISTINNTLATKSDKSSSFIEFNVIEANTNLNDYKNIGVFIFSNSVTPVNIPKGSAGILIVIGGSIVRQIWITNGANAEVFAREFSNSVWTDWKIFNMDFYSDNDSKIGYIKFHNGLIFQWGKTNNRAVTYPIAFTVFGYPLACKHGAGSGYSSPDFGLANESLSGFSIQCFGEFSYMFWYAIGY